jgi:hypothetical protein
VRRGLRCEASGKRACPGSAPASVVRAHLSDRGPGTSPGVLRMLWMFFAVGAAALTALWAATWLERWLRLPHRPTGDRRPAEHTDGHHDPRRIRPMLHPGLCHGGQARDRLRSPARPPRPGTFPPANLPARPAQAFHPLTPRAQGPAAVVAPLSPPTAARSEGAARGPPKHHQARRDQRTDLRARQTQPDWATHDHFRGKICLYLLPGLA